MLNLKARIVKNTFNVTGANNVKERVERGMLKGMNLGADELRDYIKDDLLSGSIVQKRTGQLRNALYIRRTKNKLTILFRGTHRQINSDKWAIPNSVLAEILEYGLNKSWWQPKRHQWHHGIKAHYFMKKGLQRKKQRILELVNQQVNLAVRQRTQR